LPLIVDMCPDKWADNSELASQLVGLGLGLPQPLLQAGPGRRLRLGVRG